LDYLTLKPEQATAEVFPSPPPEERPGLVRSRNNKSDI